jgi:hypothetical protein
MQEPLTDTSAYSDSKKVGVAKKVNYSMFIIWTMATLCCILVYFLSNPDGDNETKSIYRFDEKDKSIASVGNPYHKTQRNADDPFVFVNVNSKLIITQYPAYRQSDSINSKNNKMPVTSVNPNPTKIIRRPKSISNSKTEDFTIKAAPYVP